MIQKRILAIGALELSNVAEQSLATPAAKSDWGSLERIMPGEGPERSLPSNNPGRAGLRCVLDY